jgi:hypothetical protein
VTLRSNDILPLIERGRAYCTHIKNKIRHQWHPRVLPAVKAHKKLLLRLLICAKEKSGLVQFFNVLIYFNITISSNYYFSGTN